MLQITELFPHIYELHSIHGDKDLEPIFGAGQIKNPEIVLVFMNPTGKNIAAQKSWSGIRAPWCGTKNIWKMFYRLGLIDEQIFLETQTINSKDWNEEFVEKLYKYISDRDIYITNLAKCTQIDARPLKDKVFKEYLDTTKEELYMLNPKKVITFGNQVSSVLLSKNIFVSNYLNNEHETLEIKDKSFHIYPTYYPVGQGMRNMDKAIQRVKQILDMN